MDHKTLSKEIRTVRFSDVRPQSDTRRDFFRKTGMLAGGLALLGWPSRQASAQVARCAPPPSPEPPKPFQPDLYLPIRDRKSASALTASETARLRAAYAEMRKLTQTDPQDPRGWMQQANVHCWYCSGGPAEIHGKWWFFPWHRCYLYIHERILGKLIGDPNLTLCYWDWFNPADQTMPAIFTDPNNASNSLWDQNRGATPSDRIPQSIVGPSERDRVMDSPTFSIFGGGPNRGGVLEFGPHGAIHTWVGDPTFRRSLPDMGILETAARDPLFFAHHSNIDRLWDVWLEDPSHDNPDDFSWLDKRWTFWNENREWISISVRDVLDQERNLRYRYPSGGPERLLMVAAPSEGISLGKDPVTRGVQVPASLRNRFAAGLQARASAAPSKNYVLNLDGVQIAGHKHALVHVYANQPDANVTMATDIPTYLGYIALVAHTVNPTEGMVHKKSIGLDVTSRLPALLAASDEFKLTLVPAEGTAPPESALDLTVDRVYLTEE